MGAFWDAWDKYQTGKTADATAQIQQIGGLAGLMKQAQEQQAMQGIRGLMSSDAPDEVKIKGLLSFGEPGVKIAQSLVTVKDMQAKSAEAARLRELRPKLQEQFTIPGQPATPPIQGNVTPTGLMGGFQSGISEDDGPQGMVPGRSAIPASFDRAGYTLAAATNGLIPAEAALTHLGNEEDRKTRLAQENQRRIDEAAAKVEAAKQKVIDDANAAREKAKDRITQIQAAIAGRTPAQPPAPIIKETPEGVFERARDGTWKQVINPTTGKPMLSKPEEKTIAANESKDAGKNAVSDVLYELKQQYDKLQKGSGITDTTASTMDNAQAFVKSSSIGQLGGKVFGTENQSARNEIIQKRPLLLAALKKALGLNSKALDSNADVKLWLQAATDPTLDLQANLNAIANLDRMFGNGDLIEGAQVSKGKIRQSPQPATNNTSATTIRFDAQGNMIK